MHTFTGLDELIAAEGTDLGSSEWMLIDQERINTFADATGDHQWIHVDPAKAAEGPFGSTIAHGFLTLSLWPVLMSSLYTVEGISMGINYGLDKVRFLAPVLVDSRVRLSAQIAAVKALDGAAQVHFESTIEIERSPRPAAAISSIVRYLA